MLSHLDHFGRGFKHKPQAFLVKERHTKCNKVIKTAVFCNRMRELLLSLPQTTIDTTVPPCLLAESHLGVLLTQRKKKKKFEDDVPLGRQDD